MADFGRIIHEISCIETRLERLVGKWNTSSVDMNAVLMELQVRPTAGQVPRPAEFDCFDWRVIRSCILEDAEQLVANVESIYHFSYQYFNGNSVLHATHFESVLLNISISSFDLESSCYIGALWMGHLTWNANGQFLLSYLAIIKSIKKMLQIITMEEEVEEAILKRKAKFVFSKLQALVKLKPAQSIAKIASKEIKKEAKQFVYNVDHFLDMIDQIDGHLLHNQPYKTSSEISLLMHHYERLHAVIFPIQTQYQYQYYPTVGRFSAQVRLGNPEVVPHELHAPHADYQLAYGLGSIDIGARSVGIDGDIDVGEIPPEHREDDPGKPLGKENENVVLSEQTLNQQKNSIVSRSIGNGVESNQSIAEPQSFIDRDLQRSKTSLRNSILSRKSLRVSSASRPSLPNAYTLLAKHLDSLGELNDRSKKSIVG